MPITETTSPPSLVFSKNQIPLKLSVDYFSTAGVTEEQDIQFGLPDTAGDTLQLEWSNGSDPYDITFTFETSPVAADYDIATYTGSTDAEFITYIEDTLVPGLMAHPDVAEQWQLEKYESGSTIGVTFKAVAQIDHDLTLTATGFTTTIISDTSGVAPVAKTSYTVFMRIYVQNALGDSLANYRRLPLINFSPNEDEEVSVDLQPYLNEYFRESELPKASPTKVFTQCSKINRKAYVTYGEQSGDPVAKGPISQTSIFRILQGGVSTPDFPGIRDDIKSYLNNSDTIKFLTNRKKQVMYDGQFSHLYFYMSQANLVQIRIEVTRHYADGTASDTYLDTSVGNNTISEDNTYHFPIDPVTLGSTAIPDNAVAYDIKMRPLGDSWESETIKFYRRPSRTGLTLLEYQGALGATETVGLAWNRQRIGQVEKSFYEKNHDIEYDEADATRISFDEMLMQSITLTASQALEHDREHLIELFMSPEVYLRQGTNRIPVTINAGSHNMERQNEGGHFFPDQKFTITFDRQIAFSRIINLTEYCDEE